MKNVKCKMQNQLSRPVYRPRVSHLSSLIPLLSSFILLPSAFILLSSSFLLAAAADGDIVAVVGSEHDLRAGNGRSCGGGHAGPQARRGSAGVGAGQALAELVNRRLAMAYARRTRPEAAPEEVEAALANLKKQLAARGGTLAEHLQARGIDEAELRRQLAWDATWAKFSARYVTPERIESYRRPPSSSRARWEPASGVSHLFWRPADRDPQAIAKCVQAANALRAEEVACGSASPRPRKYSAAAGPRRR